MDDEKIIDRAVGLHMRQEGALIPTRALCSVDKVCGETFAVLYSGSGELARFLVVEPDRSEDLAPVLRIEAAEDDVDAWRAEGPDFDRWRDATAAEMATTYADDPAIGAIIVDDDGEVLAFVNFDDRIAVAA